MVGVQPVTEEAYEAVVSLGTQGGWEGLVVKPKKAKAVKVKEELEGETDKKMLGKKEEVESEAAKEKKRVKSKKRDSKAADADAVKEEPTEGTRRSKRVKAER